MGISKDWIKRSTLVFLTFGSAPLFAQEKDMGVAASIPPIYSLVAGVMEGVSRPDLLIRGNLSPHTYTLRPSDAKRLAHAKLIFWIGPSLETPLEAPLKTLAKNAKIIEISRNPKLIRHPYRMVHSDLSSSHTEYASLDPHLWLDLENARVIVQQVREELAAFDPSHRALYEANRDRMEGALLILHEALKKTLLPVQERTFLVFHDAYQYLEVRYGLKGVRVVGGAHYLSLKPSHRLQLEKDLKAKTIQCAFREPFFERAHFNDLFAQHSVPYGVLDPWGMTLPLGPDLYFVMMRTLVGQLAGCLPRKP